jgi:hypothetical protein
VDSEEQPALPAGRLGRALKKGITDAYDHLGLVIASSFIWSAAVLIPAAVGTEVQRRVAAGGVWFAAAGVAFAVVVGAPLLAGVFRMAYRIAYRDDPSLADLLAGFRELLGSSCALAAVNLVIVGVLAADAAFFFGVFGPLRPNWLFFGLGTLCLYALLGWLMAALYQLPVLAAQRPMGQRQGWLPAVKKSFLLAAGNPLFTIGLFVVTLGFGILCALSVIGMLALYVGAVSVLLTHALRELYIRYGVVEEPPEAVEDRGWHS